MRCPKCGKLGSKVIDTDSFDTVIRRVRKCLNPKCLHVWRTCEEDADSKLRPEMLAEANKRFTTDKPR